MKVVQPVQLAIETSSALCSVAVCRLGQYYDDSIFLGNRHSNHLSELIDQVCDAANVKIECIQEICVGNGPGLFTGIRIGVGFAQGLAYGLNVPVLTCSSLLNVAMQVLDKINHGDAVVVFVNAQMGEVYWQMFRHQSNESFAEITDIQLSHPDQAVLEVKRIANKRGYHETRICFVGDGIDMICDSMLAKLEENQYNEYYRKDIKPNALTILHAINTNRVNDVGVDRHQHEELVLPNYVRNNVVYNG